MKLNQLPENIVFKGGTIIDPYNEIKFDGDVWIKNGKIEEIRQFSYFLGVTRTEVTCGSEYIVISKFFEGKLPRSLKVRFV